MSYLILFVLGAVLGSFLNVVALRWKSGFGLGGRSHCPQCGKKLSWYELVPIVSFVLQRGRCRGCLSKISWQYPAVEVVTGLTLISLYVVYGLSSYFVLSGIVFLLYIAILIYDIRHKIIPDTLVYCAILLSVIARWLTYSDLLDWLAGPIILAFFALIWWVTRGRAIGFGDAKLGLSLGLLLGAAQGFSAVVLSFWIGAVVSVGYLVLGRVAYRSFPLLKGGKSLTMKSEIPFAPFIVFGAWASAVFVLDLLHVASF